MSDRPLHQSLLELGFRDTATFGNFIGGRDVVEMLQQQVRTREERLQSIYLWGERYAGRTHLLQAACNDLPEGERRAVYLPLAARGELAPASLQGLRQPLHLCVDDIDLICGERQWEEAVLHLMNDVRDAGGTILVASGVPPAGLRMTLADLQSRLAAALVQRVHALTDDEKERALMQRGAKRGLVLKAEVIRYIMARAHRDMGSLLAILDELDRETISQQRKVTIPFVKKVLQL